MTAVGDVLALQCCIYVVAAAAALHTSASDASLSSHSWFGWPCCEGSQIVLHIEVVTIIITYSKGGGKCFSPFSFVCLLAILLKNESMDLEKCCVSTDVWTWTN